jgi:hypothetical protein
LGGLKGQTAPGDAHPYLALFDWLTPYKTNLRFFLIEQRKFFGIFFGCSFPLVAIKKTEVNSDLFYLFY